MGRTWRFLVKNPFPGLLQLGHIISTDSTTGFYTWGHHHSSPTLLNIVLAVLDYKVVQIQTSVFRPWPAKLIEQYFAAMIASKENDSLSTMLAAYWIGFGMTPWPMTRIMTVHAHLLPLTVT
jgi:hypothetical protein